METYTSWSVVSPDKRRVGRPSIHRDGEDYIGRTITRLCVFEDVMTLRNGREILRALRRWQYVLFPEQAAALRAWLTQTYTKDAPMIDTPAYTPEMEPHLNELRALDEDCTLIWLEDAGEEDMPLQRNAYRYWCHTESGQCEYRVRTADGIAAIAYFAPTTQPMERQVRRMGHKYKPAQRTVSGIPVAEVPDVLERLDNILNER